MFTKKFSGYIAVIVLVCLLSAGCRNKDQLSIESPPAPVVSEEMHSGKLSVLYTLSATEISIAEKLLVTLEVTVPEDYDVNFPQFSGKLGDFNLSSTASTPKELIGDRIRQKRICILTPYLPGQYTIPAMTISAGERRPPGLEKAEVIIPPHIITITSFLGSNEKNPQIADIFAPLPAPAPTFYYLIGGGAGLLLIALLIYLYVRRKSYHPLPPSVSPEVGALHEIDQLRQRQTDDDFAAFYSNLSLILRRYIETRFGLNAPEQTTEEFLAALRRSPLFSEEQKDLLKHFLCHCDLIKFARIIPSRQEIDISIEQCRNFIKMSSEKIPEDNNQKVAL